MEISIKDKPVTIERLAPSVIQQHVGHLRDLHMAEVKRQMIGLPLEICKHCWDVGRAEARKIEVGTSEYIRATMTIPGLAHGLYLASQGKAELSLDEASDLIGGDPLMIDAAVFALGVMGKGSEPTRAA